MRILVWVLLLAGCSERHRAARAIDCSGEMTEVSKLTEAEFEKLELAKGSNIPTAGAGYTIAVVLGALAGGGSIPGPTVLPNVGWPHVWVGCSDVATCDENNSCVRAAWLKEGGLKKVMAKSTENPYEDLGISECGETPTTKQINSISWDLRVCGVSSTCWAVTDKRQYECVRGKVVPERAAPNVEKP